MRELRCNQDAQAEAMGLTISRAHALTILVQMEGQTQTALAAGLEVEPSTIKRNPLEGDARKNALLLTDKARNFNIVERNLPAVWRETFLPVGLCPGLEAGRIATPRVPVDQHGCGGGIGRRKARVESERERS